MPKDRQPIIICLLALIVALVGVPEVGATAPDTRLKIEPADLVVGLGETFVVQVVIEEANNLGAFQFSLVYDPSILQVTEATQGVFLESTGNSTIPGGPEVNNVEGRVASWAVSVGSAPGPSGTGVLTTITFVAQQEGSTDLELQKVQVLDMAANTQPVTAEDGQVVVRNVQAPTATTTATSMPVATTTPTATATPAPAATATSMPTNTPEVVDTPPLTATALPSPTPIVTSPAAETPTEPPTPSPSPMPSVNIAPTETKPTEVTTPIAVPTTETTQAPATPTTVPTSPPAAPAPPSPSPTPLPPSPMPSPTPLATIPVSAATSPSGGAALGLILAALAVATLAVFILSRRPGV